MNIRIIILLFYFWIGSCHSIPKSTQPMFKWFPTSCAPDKFPIELISGEFSLPNNESVGIPLQAYLTYGWGKTGSIDLVGSDEKSLPERVKIKWFSYRERKFFEGESELPTKKIKELFQKGFHSPISGKHETYNYIIVGTAPAGTVSVWLRGQGICTEVMCFKAKEVKEDIESFIGASPDLETYVRSAMAKKFTISEMAPLDSNDISLLQWETTFRRLFNWKLKVISSVPTISVLASYYNGEVQFWKDNFVYEHLDYPMPTPKKLTLNWELEDGKQGGSEISFEEAEIFSAINKITKDENKCIIQVEINVINRNCEIFLLNGKNAIKLNKCIIQP